MPIHEFHCSACGKTFDELIRTPEDRRKVVCPECRSAEVERKLSVFSAHSAAAPVKTAGGPGGCGRCGDPYGPCGL